MDVAADVSIVIVHYNTTALTTRCAESLFATRQDEGVTLEVVVIDNGSDHDTLRPLAERLPLRVVRLERGVGLSSAWNRGLGLTSGRNVLLLNSDVAFVADAVGPMCSFLDRHPRVAVVGPKLFLDEECRRVQVSSSGIFTLETALWEHSVLEELLPSHGLLNQFYMSDWKRDADRQVETVAGAAFMVKRKVFEQVHFDERYRFFYEEPDFARQLRAHGWQTWYLAGVPVVHAGSGTLRTISPLRARLFTLESMCRYVTKHYGWASAAVLCAVAAVNLPLKWLLRKALGDRSGWKRCVSAVGLAPPFPPVPTLPFPSGPYRPCDDGPRRARRADTARVLGTDRGEGVP